MTLALIKDYYNTHDKQQITYNSFKKPVEISLSKGDKVSYEYSPMQVRSTAFFGSMETDKYKRPYRKYYSAIMPVEILYDTKSKSARITTYLNGDAYSASVVHINEGSKGNNTGMHYIHRDHLGSINGITNSTGRFIEKNHFGAWGTIDKHKKYWSHATFDNFSYFLGRGYTGHEHLDDVGLSI